MRAINFALPQRHGWNAAEVTESAETSILNHPTTLTSNLEFSSTSNRDHTPKIQSTTPNLPLPNTTVLMTPLIESNNFASDHTDSAHPEHVSRPRTKLAQSSGSFWCHVGCFSLHSVGL